MSDVSRSLAELSAPEKREFLARALRQRELKSIVPASHGQKALWFLHQSAPESAAYHIAFAARIRSSLDVPALRRAFQKLIERHSVLRATFKLRRGDPVQVINEHQEICFEQADASSWSWDELNQRVLDAYRRPFDLERGPVLRVNLFTRSSDDSVMLLTIHHIAHDAWSLWSLQNELSVLYSAECAGARASLPRIEHSYADYVSWQAQMLASPEGERLWSYWQRQLAGAPPMLDLPTPLPRPAVQTYRGASHAFKLDAELARQLKALAQAEGATPFMLLLAAFQVLLYRYTGQDDLLVGAPTAGRSRPEFAGVVGYFVNPVVLRARLSGNPTFKAFLSQTRRTVLEAMAHQDYPFPLLVKRLQPKRAASYSPLFQVSFVLQKAQRAGEIGWVPGDTQTRIKWGSLELELFDLPQQEGQFDLELEMMEAAGAFHGVFKYNTDLFDAGTAARMSGHLRTLLEAIASNPDQCIEMLPLLTEAERRQLLLDWNDTRVDYPLHLCLHELFEAQVERTPDAVAVIFEGRQLTYRELNARANQLAHTLRARGVGPQTLVGICVERSLEMVMGLLAILKAGGAYVPLDPAYPAERLAFMLDDAQVAILLTQERLLEQLPATTANILCLDRDAGSWGQEPEINPQSGVTAENLAYVIYTSGSTGKPKGVQLHHRGLTNFLYAMHAKPGICSQDSVLALTTLSFDIAGLELYLPLMVGARIVLASRTDAQDARRLASLIERAHPSIMQATPATFRMLIANGWRGDPKLKILCGGEALGGDLAGALAPLGRELWNLYGPTEATIWATRQSVVSADENLATATMAVVPIGRPIANTQVYILDAHGQPTPVGVAGELHIGGVQVGQGYLHRPELTAEKFIADPFSDKPGARLYKSGDLARWLPIGNLEYLGRIDFQVKIRGFRIELGEIEHQLAQHPAVREAIVVAREDRPGDRRLAAYIVPAGEAPSSEELRHYLMSKLPDYMVPSFLVLLPALPLTPNGKVDRHALPAPNALRSEAGANFLGPRDEVERRLAHIWEEVLDVHPVGIQDNFFDLGGDSLMAVRLMALIGQAFSRNLPLPTLLQHPTIDQLAVHLREREVSRWDPLVEIQAGGSSIPFFCVPGGGGNVLYFHGLARHLGLDQSFYALQSVGLDGVSEPYTRVEDMAARYIEAIRTVQPQGPYFLGGHCFGSAVAFEMAQQLQRQGEEIALLAIFDAPAPIAGNQPAAPELDDAAWLTRIARVIEQGTGKSLDVAYEAILPLDPERQLNYLKERLQRVGFLPPEADVRQVRGLLQVFKANSQAHYVPQEVRPTRIALFRAAEPYADYDYGPGSGEPLETSPLGWDLYSAGPVSVQVVPGNHVTMMFDPHIGVLAERLGACLKQGALATHVVVPLEKIPSDKR